MLNSAALMVDDSKTPAFITFWYIFFTFFKDFLLLPEITFVTLENVCILSPGFILSGLYPTKNPHYTLTLNTFQE